MAGGIAPAHKGSSASEAQLQLCLKPKVVDAMDAE